MLSSEELSNTIRATTVSKAEQVLPHKAKGQFPEEFSTATIDLIGCKRKLMRDDYRSLRRDTKLSISADRIALLDKEAAELADTFKKDRFKGYRLLKQQHRIRTKAIMPPEKEFTEHYRTQYQLGAGEPL